MDQAKLIWVQVSLRFQNAILTFWSTLLFRKIQSPAKILLFRTGSIGDNICAIPSMVSIRRHFKHAQLHILTNAGASNLVSLESLLNPVCYDKIIDANGYSRMDLWKLVRSSHYNLIIELPQDQVSLLTQLRNLFFFRFSGVKSGWGWQVNTSFVFRQAQERKLSFSSERVRLLSILKKHGIPVSPVLEYPLRISENDEKFVGRSIVENFPEAPAKKIVAVVPGAKRPQNRYPLDRFKDLADWLVRKGYYVAIVGGPGDAELGHQLSESTGCVSFCGQLSATQSAAFLAKCICCISNDTGPMHLAYAVGTPVLALFSSRDFQQKWFPPEGNVTLRNYHVHCSLCFTDSCQNNICMQGIPLDSIKNEFELMARALSEQ